MARSCPVLLWVRLACTHCLRWWGISTRSEISEVLVKNIKVSQSETESGGLCLCQVEQKNKTNLLIAVGCGYRCRAKQVWEPSTRGQQNNAFFSQVLQKHQVKALIRGKESIENILLSCETVCNAQPFTFVCLTLYKPFCFYNIFIVKVDKTGTDTAAAALKIITILNLVRPLSVPGFTPKTIYSDAQSFPMCSLYWLPTSCVPTT